jgi:hypothetical protein
MGSDGSMGMLSPVPGSTSWESDLSEVELVKGSEGLGFSLLDFAVSVECLIPSSNPVTNHILIVMNPPMKK